MAFSNAAFGGRSAPKGTQLTASRIEKMPASLLPGLSSGLELLYPDRIVQPSTWLGHTPFALWLIEAIEPRMVVELGVGTGNSYCAFVEAVEKLSLDTRCFGVDHWKGDEHPGRYDEEVFEQLRGYHNARYASFSTLLRSAFNDALPYFADGSIDLLHIDGFHTYEAVSKNFESWLPKVSTRGIVLFHDTNVREREFGIWRFWDEISSKYPHFEFIHSHGLGIAYVGSQPLTGAIGELFAIKSDEFCERVHRYFARLGTSIVDSLEKRTLAAIVDKLEAGATAEAETRVKDLEAELRAVTLQLSKANAHANDLESKLRASTLQTRTKTVVAHQGIAVTVRLQRELLAANLAKQACERRLHDVLQSSSWRITRPVRSAVRWLKRLRPTNQSY